MKFIVEKKETNKIVKTFESFIGGKGKWDEYENITNPGDGVSGEVDRDTKNKILDVSTFNEWLANDFTGYGYQKGAPGLIGRADKLSEAMVVSYFLDQGVECTQKEINEFIDKVSKEWRNR